MARVRSETDAFEDPRGYAVPEGGYLGAIRNEYDTKARTWYLNGPVGRTGQAIVAMLIAYRRSDDPSLLDAARAMGDYVSANNQVTFETLPGLFDLAAATGDATYGSGARRTAEFVLNGGLLPEEGLTVDQHEFGEQRFMADIDVVLPERITLDDAALAQLSDETGDPCYHRQAFLAMSEGTT